jgi:hypothetical protein
MAQRACDLGVLLVPDREVEVRIDRVRWIRDRELAPAERGLGVTRRAHALALQLVVRSRWRAVTRAEARRVARPADQRACLDDVTARARERLATADDQVAIVQQMIEADRRRARLGRGDRGQRDQARERDPAPNTRPPSSA